MNGPKRLSSGIAAVVNTGCSDGVLTVVAPEGGHTVAAGRSASLTRGGKGSDADGRVSGHPDVPKMPSSSLSPTNRIAGVVAIASARPRRERAIFDAMAREAGPAVALKSLVEEATPSNLFTNT